LIGTTASIRESVVASEVPGKVDAFFVQAGDAVKKGTRLASLNSNALKLRLKAAMAVREGIRSRRIQAEKELQRVSSLKDTNSVAQRQYDEAFYNHDALIKELMKNEVDIEQLEYEISKKNVRAPFAGLIAQEHIQVGEWVPIGGSIVTLVDLNNILIKVDVPEAVAVRVKLKSVVKVLIKSISSQFMSAEVSAVLPKGNAASRTFPVHLTLPNSDLTIKSGMEAIVTFDVGEKVKALLVPKDAIVTAGNQRLVYTVNGDIALPVPIKVVGYYDNDAAIEGGLEPGMQVIIRGNERLRPGQPVRVID
jgi:RND family efflux transporter MFP subunit